MLFYIDVINACNCRCKYCYRGTFRTKPSEYELMTPELLDHILSKASREIPTKLAVGLYNWSEPFMHDRIADLVGIVKRHRMKCVLSTNLSLIVKDRLKAAFENGLDDLIVSVSGFTQETYGKYHMGGNIERVKKNLRYAAQLDRCNGGLLITVHYIEFDYNQAEKEVFHSFCDELDVGFMSKKNTFTHALSDTGDVSAYFARPSHYGNHSCPLLTDMVSIDQRGDVYICCGTWYYPAYRIGAFLDIPFHRIQQLRAMHPRCSLCR
jgi:MoaA/NifB/PqqE/SkfB family radical SAM enzyme